MYCGNCLDDRDLRRRLVVAQPDDLDWRDHGFADFCQSVSEVFLSLSKVGVNVNMNELYLCIGLAVVLFSLCLWMGKWLFQAREKRLLAQDTHLDEIEIRESCYQWQNEYLLRVVGVISVLMIFLYVNI